MLEDYDIAEWVAQADNSQRGFREAVHTILAAIANDPQLRANMVWFTPSAHQDRKMMTRNKQKISNMLKKKKKNNENGRI